MPGHFFHDESAQAHGVYILADTSVLASERLGDTAWVQANMKALGPGVKKWSQPKGKSTDLRVTFVRIYSYIY